MGVNISYKAAKAYRLASFHNRKDNASFRMGVCSLRLINCCASVKLMVYKIAYRLWVYRNYGKVFAKIEVFDCAVDNKRLCKKPQNGEKTCLKIENKNNLCLTI